MFTVELRCEASRLLTCDGAVRVTGRSVIHVLSLSLWQMLKKRGSSVEPPPGSLSDMCVDEMLELMVDHWLLT